MKAQGIVEYALILILVLVLVVTIVVVSLIVAGNEPCASEQDNSFTCRDARVQECIASERYTREECIVLMGSGAPK